MLRSQETQEEHGEKRCLCGEVVARSWHDADGLGEVIQVCQHFGVVAR